MAGNLSPRTVLITAAAYVGPELAAEFGRLPPAFLPVGNRRLFTHQHGELAGRFDRVILSLPADFDVADHDLDLLRRLGMEIVKVPTGLDLPSSILHVIAHNGIDSGPLALLHGDTLVYDVDYRVPDTVSVAKAVDAYSWAGCNIVDGRVTEVFPVAEGGLNEGPVLSGFFNFEDLNLLVLSLAASRGDFVDMMKRYLAKRPMRAAASHRWLDFGHLHTYYASRGRITTERAFNSLEVGDRIVAKRSARADRIEAEAGWYEKVPRELTIYLPHYLGRERRGEGAAYKLEFLFMPSLADLFVFARLPEATWVRILQSCAEFMAAASKYRAPSDSCSDVMDLYLPKTLARLAEFSSASGIDLDRGWKLNGCVTPGLLDIARQTSEWILPPEPRHLTVLHGDLCFSNILYDFRSHSVRVIDPRGQSASGSPTIYGDNRYDLAKLHHSMIGNYDLIVAGLCDIDLLESHSIQLSFPDDPSFQGAKSAFDRVLNQPNSRDSRSIEAISIHLFLSMLPLHSDSPVRQRAILANALRLYLQTCCRKSPN